MFVAAWCLNLVYAVVAGLAAPWLVYRRVVLRKPVAGIGAKLSGDVRRLHPRQPCVWFHAVSVGEVLQLPSLVAQFLASHPDHEVIITTTTGTGYAVAKQKFPALAVSYWPFDFSFSVTRALRKIRPSLVVLVELEVWPNFLRAARREQVPVVVVNGRLSERSHRGYRRLGFLTKPIFGALRHVAAQTEASAARFRDLGVPADRVTVTGNLKYDRIASQRDNPQTRALRTVFGLADDELVWIAGSTQDPEERLALETYQTLAAEFPGLRLMLVPRHQERFEEVVRLVMACGLPLSRRTKPTHATDRPVLLLDTLGELGAAWGLAELAFVGGSLTQRGGQNMLEPAGYGAAVCFGPNTWNFREIVTELLERDAACVVTDGASLTTRLRTWLLDETERRAMGRRAREFVLTQHGATARTLEILQGSLSIQFLPVSRAA